MSESSARRQSTPSVDRPEAFSSSRSLPAGQAIDFLSVDCEGSDLGVLRSNDWDRFQPRVIAVEDWQKESEGLMEKELVDLGLLKMSDIKKQNPDDPALKKYFMHGIGHPLGLDVHDLGNTTEPMQAGWVLTVEPGIYIKEEGFAIRLENDIVVQKGRNLDLMESTPLEADEIEHLMKR